MGVVNSIQCPSCGSNSTFKLFDGDYKCNYCQSTFSVTQAQQQVTRPQPGTRSQATTPTKANPKLIIAFSVGVFLLMGVCAGIFLTTGLVTDPGNKESYVKAEEKPSLQMSRGFAGNKGAAIWLIYEHKAASDSVWYKIYVIDPKTKLISGEQILFPLFKQDGTHNLNTKLGYQFWQYNDLVYTISNDNGLVAYDIYSGAVELTEKTLTEKFPDLASGILKVEDLSSERAFKITTTTGDVFKFDQDTQTLLAKNEKPARTSKKETVSSELYLSDGLKHQLYLLTKSGDGFPIVFGGYVQESRIEDLKGEKGKNVKDIFGNINIEKVSDNNYFAAQPLLKDDEQNIVLFYKSDLSDKATVILESITKEGKTNWSLKDPLFLKIAKGSGSDNIGAVYGYSKDLIVLFIQGDPQAYMGIDIKSGTVAWTFYPYEYKEK